MHAVPLAAGGLVTLAAAMGIGRFAYTPILPLMVERLGLSQSEAGLIASGNYAGYLVGALIAALPALRGSPRAWLLGALAANALATGLMGIGSAAAFFVAVRFVAGVASAFAFVFTSTLVLDRLAQAGRSGLSAVHFAGVGVGIALAAILVSASVSEGLDWRQTWFVNAAAGALAVAVVALLIPDRGVARGSLLPAGSAPPPRALKSLILAYGLFGFGYVITATFLVALVRGAPEMRAVEPVIWLIVGLAALPSVALWNRLGASFGIYRMFAAGCVVEAAGVAASVLWTSLTGAVVSAILLGGTFVSITALGIAGARRLAPANPQRTLALMTAAFGLGQIVGPAFAGFVHDITGTFTWPSLAGAGALLIAAALALPLETQPLRSDDPNPQAR